MRLVWTRRQRIEQIAYSRSSQGMHDVALLRSLSSKTLEESIQRPSVITYGDDSEERFGGDLNADGWMI